MTQVFAQVEAEMRKEDAEARAEKPAPSFGGLTPAEAAKKRWEKAREAPVVAADTTEGDLQARLENMRFLARTGKGTTAVQAQRYLDEHERRQQGAQESASILELLTPEQRAIVRGWLSQGAVDGDTDTEGPA